MKLIHKISQTRVIFKTKGTLKIVKHFILGVRGRKIARENVDKYNSFTNAHIIYVKYKLHGATVRWPGPKLSTVTQHPTLNTPYSAPGIWIGNPECGVWILSVECWIYVISLGPVVKLCTWRPIIDPTSYDPFIHHWI